MAKKPDARKRLARLLDELEPIIRAAFMDAVADITSNVEVGRLADMIERGDIDGAMRAVHLDPASFRGVERAIATAYETGGIAAAATFPKVRDALGHAVVVRFDVRDPRAEKWLREHSSDLVTSISTEQRDVIRAALEEGIKAGSNPRSTALNIVGRIDKATGRRAGGVIGLASNQAEFVNAARAELQSGDPALLRNYLTRTRRDRRFDSVILKAIKNETPLDGGTVDRIAGRYADRLLDLRGEMIARTETLTSVRASKHEAFRQGLDKTGYGEEVVTREWDSAGDSKVRHTHAAMDGQVVEGLDTPFVSPSGAKMMYPGDTSLGADASEIIGCRCDEKIRIDFSAGLS